MERPLARWMLNVSTLFMDDVEEEVVCCCWVVVVVVSMVVRSKVTRVVLN